LKARLKNVQ